MMNITIPSRIFKLATLLVCISATAQAQQLKLGKNPTVLKRSALLELDSDNQGLLLTRVTDTTAVSPLFTADDGTLIYLKSDNSLYIRSLAGWRKLSTGSGTGTITLNGDVTGTGTGTVPATISNQAVSFAKFQNINTQRLLGRYTAGAGSMQEISLNSSLKLNTGGTLYADSALAIWNASKIQSRRVLDTVPGTGDVLKWNPTRAMWLPSQDITGGAAYGTLANNDIRNAIAPDPQYRMKIWASPISGVVQNGPLGTGAHAWSVLSFQMQASPTNSFTTQLYFDKNTLALKEWGGIDPLTTNTGNTWYKVVTTHGDNSFTDGGIIFAGKTSDANTEVRQDDDNLHWDNNSKELGIGTNTPAAKLDVNGNFQLGANGTTFTNMFRLPNVQVTFNNGNFDQGATYEVTVNLNTPLAGRQITANSTIIVNPTSALPGGINIAYVRRSTNTSIIIALTTTSNNNNLNNVNRSFDITVIQ